MEGGEIAEAGRAAESSAEALSQAEELTKNAQGEIASAPNNAVVEEIEERTEKAQNIVSQQVLEKLPSGKDVAVDDVKNFSDTSRELADEVGGAEEEVIRKAQGKVDSLSNDTKKIEKSMRSMFQYMSDSFDSMIKSVKGDKATDELNSLNNNLTEAIKTGDPEKIREATANLDSYVSENLTDVDDKIKENTEGKGSVDMFTRIKPYLKVLGLAAILALTTIMFMKDTGCWKFSNGVKSLKINDFDFKNNKQYCACSDSDNFSTPQPLSSWCPPGVKKGSPTYVTCEPYNYPACTVQESSDGLYYGYYVSSPMGVFNTALNQAGRAFRGVTYGFSNMIANIILIITVLLVLFMVAKGATAEEDGNTYYIIAAAIGAIGGGVYYKFKS